MQRRIIPIVGGRVTGRISGTPTTPGTYAVTLKALNDRGSSAIYMFTWTVTP